MSIKGISNWSIVIALAGLSWSAVSFIRYYLLYPDLDRMIVYTLIGIMIAGFGWVYNQILKQGNEITAIEDYLDDRRKE